MADHGRLDAFIIVPPFASIDNPSLGCHVLQAVAKKCGYHVHIEYLNMIFARILGIEKYREVVKAPPLLLVGERLLAPYAHPEYFHEINDHSPKTIEEQDLTYSDISRTDLTKAIKGIQAYLEQTFSGYSGLVGLSSTFEQINSSVIVSKLLKQICPNAIQIVGGANCEGEMAEGQEALLTGADFIFSGESESAFVKFLKGERPPLGTKIVYGTPNSNLEELPIPDFKDYFYQLRDVFGSDASVDEQIQLPYESSRGCWWGAKHHCTFCGLNGEGMSFRAKSAEKVSNELIELYRSYGIKRFFMTDNIMPHQYFRSLLPMLTAGCDRLDLFYEQKANISLDKIVLLREAGISHIQPGIESLDNRVLSLMKKGVRADQNISLLRYCRSADIVPSWNIICGFPNEGEAPYAELTRIVPLLYHLQPPSGLSQLSIDRFSPYHKDPDSYGISSVRPHHNYLKAFPSSLDLNKISYHFEGDVDGCLSSTSKTYTACREAIELWKGKWKYGSPRPVLHVVSSNNGFILIDTRHGNKPSVSRITESQAKVCIAKPFEKSNDVDWALDYGFGIMLDEIYIPLATADPRMISAAESRLPLLDRFPVHCSSYV